MTLRRLLLGADTRACHSEKGDHAMKSSAFTFTCLAVWMAVMCVGAPCLASADAIPDQGLSPSRYAYGATQTKALEVPTKADAARPTRLLWVGCEPDRPYPVVTALLAVDTAEELYGRFRVSEHCIGEYWPDLEIIEETFIGGGGERVPDVAFVFDDTGSMGGVIQEMKAEAIAFAEDLAALAGDVAPRFALISFKDDYALRLALTEDATRFAAAVNTLQASGGGDGPEFSLDAAVFAARTLDWSPDRAPVIVIITDAPTHYRGSSTENPADWTIDEGIAELASRGIRVFTMAPSYVLSGPYAANPGQLALQTGGRTINMDTETLAGALGILQFELMPGWRIRYRAPNLVRSGIVRVDPARMGAALQDGRSWDTAFSDIQSALDWFLIGDGSAVAHAVEIEVDIPSRGVDMVTGHYVGGVVSFGSKEVWLKGGVHDGGRPIAAGRFDGTDRQAWTAGQGWTLGGGKATHVGGAGSLTLASAIQLEPWRRYRVVFDLDVQTRGQGITPIVGGKAGPAVTASGRFDQWLEAGYTDSFSLLASRDFNGTVRNLSIIESRADMVVSGLSALPFNSGAVVFHAGLTVRGGFAGTETDPSQRNLAASPSIIDGSTARDGYPAIHAGRVGGYRSGGSQPVHIEDVTFRGGHASRRNELGAGDAADMGGGLLIERVPVTLVRCRFEDNSGEYGGGLAARFAAPVIRDCTFDGNSALQSGGAIHLFNCQSDTTIEDSVFYGNRAHAGGAISTTSSIFTVRNNWFGAVGDGNYAEGEGGSAYLFGSLGLFQQNLFTGNSAKVLGGAVSLVNSRLLSNGDRFSGNYSAGDAGAVRVEFSSIDMDGAVFDGNTAAARFGALAFVNSRDGSTVRQSRFEANSAGATGGAIGINVACVEIDQSMILSNRAQGHGGGVFLGGEYSDALIRNTLVASNTTVAGRGAGMYIDGYKSNVDVRVINATIADNTGDPLSGQGALHVDGVCPVLVANTIIADNAPCGIAWGAGATPPNVFYSLVEAVEELSCGLAQGNKAGFAGFVRQGDEPYRVRKGSPAVGAGSGAYGTVADICGAVRSASAPDMGAYEGALSVTLQGARLAVRHSSVEFGQVDVGNQVAATIEITNTGDMVLQGTASTFAPFGIVRGGTYRLNPNAVHTLEVAFAPDAIGLVQGTLVLSGGGGASVPLQGEGTGVVPPPPPPPPPPQVTFADPGLERAVRTQLRVGTGPLYLPDVAAMKVLNAAAFDILDLGGIEQCSGLKELHLTGNALSRIGPLATLPRLEVLGIGYNSVRDLAPLAGLTALREVNLTGNDVRDLSPLLANYSLRKVFARSNPLDAAACSVVTQLRERGVSVDVDISCEAPPPVVPTVPDEPGPGNPPPPPVVPRNPDPLPASAGCAGRTAAGPGDAIAVLLLAVLLAARARRRQACGES